MIVIVVALLVLATRVAAGHPPAPDHDEPTSTPGGPLDDTLDTLDDTLDDTEHVGDGLDDPERDEAFDADRAGELRTLDGALVDRVDLLDLVERGDLDRIPLVEAVPATRRPSWLGRLDVSVAWRRRIAERVRSLEALPTSIDELWLLATWSR